jgi:putative transposase
MRTELMIDALAMAITRRRPDTDGSTILHSDHGAQGGIKWSSQHG